MPRPSGLYLTHNFSNRLAKGYRTEGRAAGRKKFLELSIETDQEKK